MALYESERTLDPHGESTYQRTGLGRVARVYRRSGEPDDADRAIYVLEPLAIAGDPGWTRCLWAVSRTTHIRSRRDLADSFQCDSQHVRELAMRAAADLEGT